MAACLWTSGVTSHRAALKLLGIDGYSGNIVEVTSAGAKRSSTEVVRFHCVRTLDSCDVTRVGPIPTTTPTRTLIDVGSVLSPARLEEAIDSALRLRLTSIDRLREGIERLGGSGRKGPNLVARLVDERGAVRPAESPLETRLVRLLRRNRLPQPERQFLVQDAGGLIGRLDFAYPQFKIAIEVQSYRWHSGRSAWRKDMERLNRLQALGWIVIQVGYEDLERHPEEVARRIRAALDLRLSG